MANADYRKHLEGIGKSNPEKLEMDEQRRIHKTLRGIVADEELREAVKKYGHPISFASGRGSDGSFNGYSHLELNPESGLMIVMTELDFMADHFSENHDSEYPLYIKGNKVYFDGEDKKMDAAKAVRHAYGGCNVDYSRAQTAEGISNSLEAELAKRNKGL